MKIKLLKLPVLLLALLLSVTSCKVYLNQLNKAIPLEEAIIKLERIRQLEPANAQLNADLGWIYLQSGQIEEGISLLLEYPLEPSYSSSVLFPGVREHDKRQQLYLQILKAFNEQLNGTTLVLGHIFVTHLSRELIFAQELITKLQTKASQTGSPIYFDALRELFYQQNDWTQHLHYAEAVISSIEELEIEVTDKTHLSHFYYNSACSYSMAKRYEMSSHRLKQAFAIDRSLRDWSLLDPNLQNLREHLGEKQFRALICSDPK